MCHFFEPSIVGQILCWRNCICVVGSWYHRCSCTTPIIQGCEDLLSRVSIEPIVETKEYVVQLGCWSRKGLGLMPGKCGGFEGGWGIHTMVDVLPGLYMYRNSNTRIWSLCISENGRSLQWKVWAGEILEHLLRLVTSQTNIILYRKSSAYFVSGLLPNYGQSRALWKKKDITIYLWQRTIALPLVGDGIHRCVHKQSCDITACRAEKPPILTPPLHILYIFSMD